MKGHSSHAQAIPPNVFFHDANDPFDESLPPMSLVPGEGQTSIIDFELSNEDY